MDELHEHPPSNPTIHNLSQPPTFVEVLAAQYQLYPKLSISSASSILGWWFKRPLENRSPHLFLCTQDYGKGVCLCELESWRRIELPEDTKRDSGDMNPLLPSSTATTTTHKCSTCNKVWVWTSQESQVGSHRWNWWTTKYVSVCCVLYANDLLDIYFWDIKDARRDVLSPTHSFTQCFCCTQGLCIPAFSCGVPSKSHKFIAGQTHRDKQPSTLTFRPAGNLELTVKQTCMTLCLNILIHNPV